LQDLRHSYIFGALINPEPPKLIMKKNLLVLAICVCSSAAAFSQSFMHGVGLNIVVATASGGKAAVNEGITYNPRFNFIEQDDMSVSVGVPLTLGASFSYNASYDSYYGNSSSSSFSFMANIPVMINLNMGAGSTKETESRFGYFVGGGFGYHYGAFNLSDALDYSDDGYRTHKTSSVGPMGNAGIRFGVGRGTHNIEIKFQYMKGLTDVKPNIFGVGTAFNF